MSGYEYYKNKYLDVKYGGSNSSLVIHICGPSGSGKTTLGLKIQKYYKKNKNIIVKDLDTLRNDFIKKNYKSNFMWKNFDSKKYQLYLNQFINKHKKLNHILILTGLNHIFFHDKNIYYDVQADYKYYISIDDKTVIKQKCIRFITDELQDIIKLEGVQRDITYDNKKFVRLVKENIERECGVKHTKELNKMWNRDYKKQKYMFMSADDIYKDVIKKINKKY